MYDLVEEMRLARIRFGRGIVRDQAGDAARMHFPRKASKHIDASVSNLADQAYASCTCPRCIRMSHRQMDVLDPRPSERKRRWNRSVAQRERGKLSPREAGLMRQLFPRWVRDEEEEIMAWKSLMRVYRLLGAHAQLNEPWRT